MSIRSPLMRGTVLALAIFGWSAEPAYADWRDDAGLPQLSAELGAALPTGAGIVILQSEADLHGYQIPGVLAYLPQATSSSPYAGTGEFAGKTLYADSGVNESSGHAAGVGSHFYGVSASASPGITDVHVRDAVDFLNTIDSATPPPTLPGSVSNHSWTGSTGTPTDDQLLLREFDYQIHRDGILACVPLNNNTGAVPALMACSYNALTVGRRDGIHSRGGTVEDGSGRMKPDIVVNQPFTSYASPSVASVAAMLRQKIIASHPAADNPQTIRALILAGASKARLPVWRRAASTAPYDAIYGAGELNVLNAYHILAQGQQPSASSTEVSNRGWDCRQATTAGTKLYFFTIPNGFKADTFSAVLSWDRVLSISSGSYISSLPHLTLTLYPASGLVISGAAIDQSTSTLDNVQHVFQRNLPAGQYALEIATDTDDIDYGLAWEAQTGIGPTISIRRDSSAHIFLDFAQLDPYVTYTIEQGSDLVAWSPAATIRTADTTPATTATWQDPSSAPITAKFYRLKWTAVR